MPEDATTRDVIKQAIAKAGGLANLDHDYVLLEEVKALEFIIIYLIFI